MEVKDSLSLDNNFVYCPLPEKSYKVLLVEDGLFLTEEQKECLQRMNKHGLDILHVGKSCDSHCLKKLSGYNELALKALTSVKDLRITHVCKEGRHFYLMTNEGNETLRFFADTKLRGCMEFWNPWDGSITPVSGSGPIPVTLGYRESLILAVDPAVERTITFESGEVISVEALSSENVRYTAEIEVAAGEAYMIAEVSHSGEIAALYVDGVAAGVRMWAPYRFSVGGLLAEGTHTITLEITDPMVKKGTDKMPVLTLLK